MSSKSGFQLVMKKVIRFIDEIIVKIKKADKRFVMMVVAAIALLIIILALIVHSVGSDNKKEDETTTLPPQGYISDEPSTDAEPAVNDTVIAVGAGKYKVNTGSDASLNMRPTAGTDYGVITTIPNGTVIDVKFVDDVSGDKWGYIEYNNNRGWVAMEYLTAE